MYMIYGKHKDDEAYQMLNVGLGEFVNRRIHASLFAETWGEVERLCHDLEQSNPDFVFESRTA